MADANGMHLSGPSLFFILRLNTTPFVAITWDYKTTLGHLLVLSLIDNIWKIKLIKKTE